MLVRPGASPARLSAERVVLGLLAAGVALRLAWLAAGLARLGALRRRARPLAPRPDSVEAAARRTDAEAGFLVSSEVGSPVTLGWLRPAVLLPEAFASLDPAQQEAVACHELLDVKRRDAWPLLLEEGVRAVLWAQPAALSLASPVAALPFHTRSHLVKRVAHLTKEVPMSRRSLVFATAATAALLLLVGAAGAAAFPFGDAEPPAKATPAAPSDVLKVGGDVMAPVEVRRVQPTYPEELRNNRVQGTVILSAVIDEKGAVTKVEAVESPAPEMTKAAVEAVRLWTYRPATKKGKPVKVHLTVTVSFKLA